MTLRPHKPQDKGYFFKFYNGINVALIRYTFEDNGFRESTERNQEWSFAWASSNIKAQTYQALTRNQIVNHFPKSTEMTRKDCMYRHLARLRETHGKLHLLLSVLLTVYLKSVLCFQKVNGISNSSLRLSSCPLR